MKKVAAKKWEELTKEATSLLKVPAKAKELWENSPDLMKEIVIKAMTKM